MLGAITAGLGLASGIASLFTSGKTQNTLSQAGQLASGASNYLNQVENQNYNRSLQQQAWQRDDSYYQRLVNDLNEAGINPAVAAEKSAQTSTYHSSDPVQSQSQILEDMVKNQITMNQQAFENKITQDSANARNALVLAEAEEKTMNNAITRAMIDSQPNKTQSIADLKHDLMLSRLATSNSYVANMSVQNKLLSQQVALNDMQKLIQAENLGLISKENASYYLRSALDYTFKAANTAISAYGAYNYGRFNDSYAGYVDALSKHYGEMDDLNFAKFNYYTMGGGSSFL